MGTIKERQKHIEFTEIGLSDTGKTKVWAVKNISGPIEYIIGEVKWNGPFRKYAYFPLKDTVYDWFCLAEISQFLVVQTEDHKSRKETR